MRGLRLRPLPLLAYAAIALILAAVAWGIPAAGLFELPEVPGAGGGRTFEATVAGTEELERQERGGRTIVRECVAVEADGERIELERTFIVEDPGSFSLERGDRVLVTEARTEQGTRYFLADRVRSAPLWTLGLAFAALVVLVGGWRGAWSLVGLAASVLIILRFIVPAILAGYEPVLVAIAGALLVMVTTLTLTHGVTRVTAVALAGTGVSLLLTGALAAASIRLAALTGLADEEAGSVWVLTNGAIDLQGLLLAAIIIGALGVLDDVTATQASTVIELRRASARLGLAELYRRGMNVGREHIAATVNTLVLAYAGAALPLLMLLALQPEPAGILISRDVLATELVRTLAGSIGIVSAVPITTAVAALAASRMADGSPEAEPRFVDLLGRRER
jgi:uncharacterized membrane protein